MTKLEIEQQNRPEWRASLREEQRIVRKLIKTILTKGYSVSVCDGEEWTLSRSTKYSDIIDAIRTTDEDILRVYDGKNRLGFVQLIWGNGEDVIADCTAKPEIEAIVDIAQAWNLER